MMVPLITLTERIMTHNQLRGLGNVGIEALVKLEVLLQF